MEDDCKTSHRNLIVSWLSRPFEKSQILGEDEFVSLIEENEIKSYLYHPDMEVIQSVLQENADTPINQEVSISDIYNYVGIEKDCLLLPNVDIDVKQRRDAWFKYHITDADMTKREDGVTPLSVACYHGKCHIVNLLLSLLQHSPDAQSKDGTTPIMETVAAVADDTEERIQCIQELIKHGASAYIQNNTGHNVLTLAAYKGNVTILEYLDLCFGGSLDWNHRTDKGHTPLMAAVYGESIDIVKYLITTKKVDPLLKNNDYLNAMDISLLLNSPVKIIGLLAAYMSSEKHVDTYIKQQVEMVKNIERKVKQDLTNCPKLEKKFLCCLLSVAYLGGLPDVRAAIFDNFLVDYLDQSSIWMKVSPHLRTEFWLILAAHTFLDGDAKAMSKLLDTTWAVLQFHNESIYLVECEAYRLDRFMGILMFFLLAENGKEWIESQFNNYPELALMVCNYEYSNDQFAKGFHLEVMNLLKSFHIQEGLSFFKRQQNKCDEEKRLKKRIAVLTPKVNGLITYVKANHSELEVKLKILDRELRAAKFKDKMSVFTDEETAVEHTMIGCNGDSPNKGDNDDGDFTVVSRQQKRRNKKAKDRKLIAELRSKKVINCDVTATNDRKECTSSNDEHPNMSKETDDVMIEEHCTYEAMEEAKIRNNKDLNLRFHFDENVHSDKPVSGKDKCPDKSISGIDEQHCLKQDLNNSTGSFMGETVCTDKPVNKELTVKDLMSCQPSNKSTKHLNDLQTKRNRACKKQLECAQRFGAPRFLKQIEGAEKINSTKVIQGQNIKSHARPKTGIAERAQPLVAVSQNIQFPHQRNDLRNECMKVAQNHTEEPNTSKDSKTEIPNQENTQKYQSIWDIVQESLVKVDQEMNPAKYESNVERSSEIVTSDTTHDFMRKEVPEQSNKLNTVNLQRRDKFEDGKTKSKPVLCDNTSTTFTNVSGITTMNANPSKYRAENMDKVVELNVAQNITLNVSETKFKEDQQNPVQDCSQITESKAMREINLTTMKAKEPFNYQNCFNDPAIISMAKPTCDNHSENDQVHSRKDSNCDRQAMPSVFPSASHEPIFNILQGYFPATSTKMYEASSKESEKNNRSGSNESGYITPKHLDDKIQNVLLFYQNWQRKSNRWRSLLTQLQSKPECIKRVGTLNILFDDDKYLSKGSCGTIVRVGIRDDGLEVAVKCLVRGYKGLIQNELKGMRELQHPNIVQYKDYVEDCCFAYIAMELCEYTLEEFVLQLMKSKMLHIHTRRLCLELMTGLKALHDAKILHMDLKPRNILIDTSGNVRLADFGLSHKLSGEETTFYHNAEYGTRCWRAPETISAMQIPGMKGRYKQTSDIYVAGMILFFIHTGGRHPFDGTPNYPCEKKILDGCSPNIMLLPKDGTFSHLLAKMLNKDMNKRVNTDEAISDQRRLDFLVCVGRDDQVSTTICKRFTPNQETYLRSNGSAPNQVAVMYRELVDYMGWKKADLSSVLNVLSTVMCDIDDKCHEIPRPIREVIGEPSTYILSCFPNILMAIYHAVTELQYSTRRGLRKYYYAKYNYTNNLC